MVKRKVIMLNQKAMQKELDAILERATADPNVLNAVVAGVCDAKNTVYLRGAGVRDISDPSSKVEKDDMFLLYSCTKALTTLGVLVLYDQRKINLDVPASTYLPIIGDIGIITEDMVDFETGELLAPPKKANNPVTIRHLLLHTAGFSYPFLDPVYMALDKKNPENNALNASRKFFVQEKVPLLFEPGTQWSYGHSIDWLGVLIEEVTGKRLGQFLKEVIFDPAGMTSSTFHPQSDSNRLKLYLRGRKGTLKPIPAFKVTEQDMGGQGCWSTTGDYLKFLQIFLNDGATASGHQVVRKSTLKYALQNHLPPGFGIDPTMNYLGWDVADDPLDGMTLTSHGISENKSPSGRPKGTIYWSGLANLIYWIDLENKIAGFWGEQILPIADSVSLEAFREWETAVYKYVTPTSKI